MNVQNFCMNEKTMLYIFECVKISRIHHAYQIKDIMKMVDYQFIIQLPKVYV